MENMFIKEIPRTEPLIDRRKRQIKELSLMVQKLIYILSDEPTEKDIEDVSFELAAIFNHLLGMYAVEGTDVSIEDLNEYEKQIALLRKTLPIHPITLTGV